MHDVIEVKCDNISVFNKIKIGNSRSNSTVGTGVLK